MSSKAIIVILSLLMLSFAFLAKDLGERYMATKIELTELKTRLKLEPLKK